MYFLLPPNLWTFGPSCNLSLDQSRWSRSWIHPHGLPSQMQVKLITRFNNNLTRALANENRCQTGSNWGDGSKETRLYQALPPSRAPHPGPEPDWFSGRDSFASSGAHCVVSDSQPTGPSSWFSSDYGVREPSRETLPPREQRTGTVSWGAPGKSACAGHLGRGHSWISWNRREGPLIILDLLVSGAESVLWHHFLLCVLPTLLCQPS